MTAKQQLGFALAGIAFVLGGAVMFACGWVYEATSLKGQGVMLALAGVCWLILTAFVRKRLTRENRTSAEDDGLRR